MDITSLIKNNRSYRRFDQSVRIDEKSLVHLIEMTRFSASGTNRQPLKYLLYWTEEECNKIFPYTKWAGYLKDWDGPDEGERPSAYIVILGDRDIADNFFVDHGIAAQSILLSATDLGYGGCMIGSISRSEMRRDLKIPDRFDILLIVALGKPVEKVVIDTAVDNDIKYWRDSDNVHHVPKRSLEELIIKL